MSATRAWSNWAGNQRAEDLRIEHPASLEEVARLVVRCAAEGRRVKAVGAGHSFTGLARAEGCAVVLDRMRRLRRLDSSTGRVLVEAGATLHELSCALVPAGLALENLGDIDVQTVAGAIATGTHGTGARFGGLAGQVTGLELVLADGTLRWCSPETDPELFDLARINLGALGVVTAVELQAVPLFALAAEESTLGLEPLLERFDELTGGADHFEAYWFPHTGRVSTKRNTRVEPDALDPLPAWREWFDESFLQNTVFGATIALGRRVPGSIPLLNRIAAGALGERRYTDLSYRVFATPRRVRFREMEYAVARVDAVDAIRAVTGAVNRSALRVAFPVELRVAAADDVALSTAYGQETAYIAVHLPAELDHRRYFDLVEGILGDFGGRPHWGKLHTLGAGDLAKRHPRFDDFAALRARLDPTGVFANAELQRILPPLRTAG